jgi:transposase
LSAAGINNLVVHAASVEVSSRDRVKTDKRDSKKLASHLSNGNLHSIRIPSEEEELFRLLARTREQLSRAITRVRIQIRMKLHQFGLMDPNDDRVLTRKTVNSILLQDIPCELKVSIKLLLLTWENLLLQKRSLEKNLYERIENDPVTTKWRRIVGMGPTSSIVLSSELGDMKQFANERSLFSFTGLTPSEYSSGEKVRRGHISRQGSARLRHTLVEAAWRAIRKDEALNAAYQRIAMRRGKTIAIVAIARKLVGRARAVFLSGQEYELNYSQTVAV